MARSVLVTGAGGFLGTNLCLSLQKFDGVKIHRAFRDTDVSDLKAMLQSADLIFHLAGVNRSDDQNKFRDVNVGYTNFIADYLEDINKSTAIIFASTIKVEEDCTYGRTKLLAEERLKDYQSRTGSPVYILRLPNVFGKWSRPDYNSVVATFCFNIARDRAIRIDNPHARVRLLHIGDAVSRFLEVMDEPKVGFHLLVDFETHELSIQELATNILRYHDDRKKQQIARVGCGFERQLYATYVSYLPPSAFKYKLQEHSDPRGKFVELLKTIDSGQVGYFTALPGITRGGHFHNVKTEKFLVVSGSARFQLENIFTNESVTIETSGEVAEVVESIPGWAHDITNIGDSTLVVIVWANEVFDSTRPDTVARALQNDKA